MTGFALDDLVILEMANNHQGSLAHGLRIVRAMAEVVRAHDVRAAVKLQLRDLDTFIHEAHRAGSSRKHVDRFLSTRLALDDLRVLVDEIRAQGLAAICTPFDEPSARQVRALGCDALKIGSCSARDWPLLEVAVDTGLPLICSTGGLALDDVDNLVSFLEHRGARFALMHCVALYPTPPEHMALGQLDLLRARYPGVPIGWSTHEDPEDTEPVQLAVAKGAALFERHVGVEAEGVRLNAYSSSPAQVDRWLAALVRARVLCRPLERDADRAEERASLATLERGVFAKEPLTAGQALDDSHVYFAFPREPAQLTSGAFRAGAVLERDVAADAPLVEDDVILPPPPAEAVLKKAVHRVKGLLHEARVALSSSFTVEYSHHRGVERFFETGAVLIECVRRAYVKKIIVQLPGQVHPEHFHRHKEETFQVLHGELRVQLDDREHVLQPGETLLIQPGVFHGFSTTTGVVFEELSTRGEPGDSVYRDPDIDGLAREARKTIVDHWGRFSLQGPVP